MTDDELSKLLAEATPGPWEIVVTPKQHQTDVYWYEIVADGFNPYVDNIQCALAEAFNCNADARLIAAAPALAAEVLALRADVALWKLAKEAVERDVDREYKRAEAAEAALSEARAEVDAMIAKAVDDALEGAAKAVDARGQEEQFNFGLGRETQNFYRARDIIRTLSASGGDA